MISGDGLLLEVFRFEVVEVLVVLKVLELVVPGSLTVLDWVEVRLFKISPLVLEIIMGVVFC